MSFFQPNSSATIFLLAWESSPPGAVFAAISAGERGSHKGGIEFDWDAENARHLKRHRVTPDEFEETDEARTWNLRGFGDMDRDLTNLTEQRRQRLELEEFGGPGEIRTLDLFHAMEDQAKQL